MNQIFNSGLISYNSTGYLKADINSRIRIKEYVRTKWLENNKPYLLPKIHNRKKFLVMCWSHEKR